MQTCPICMSTSFKAYNGRKAALCSSCGAMERGRLTWVLLQRTGCLSHGKKLLNIAPESFMIRNALPILGCGYQPADIHPDQYKNDLVKIMPIDLCKDPVVMKSNEWDCIVHNHVLEHIPCDWMQVLIELSRTIKPGGFQIFSVPIFRGRLTEEDLSDSLSPLDRTIRFGQADHMRAFGIDFPDLLNKSELREGLVPITEYIRDQELSDWAVPIECLTNLSPHSVFVWHKPYE